MIITLPYLQGGQATPAQRWGRNLHDHYEQNQNDQFEQNNQMNK